LIIRLVIHDREAPLLQQLAVLGSIQARMKKRFSFQLPEDHSVRGPRGEHKCGSLRGMIPKCPKNLPLIAVVEMKEAVPRNDAVKSSRQTESPHIRYLRMLFGQVVLKHSHHRRRGIYTHHRIPALV
jgi:hypothetical protein